MLILQLPFDEIFDYPFSDNCSKNRINYLYLLLFFVGVIKIKILLKSFLCDIIYLLFLLRAFLYISEIIL